MGFREHVLNLFTRPDIPVRYIMRTHDFFLFRCQTFPLTHLFHDCERLFTLQSLLNQIDHDIITRANRRGNGCLSLFDKSLCIAKPYIGTMGQTGDTDQIRKILWFGVN